MVIIYTLVVAHFVADFLAQSDWMALNKSKRWDALALHVGVYSAVLGGFVMLAVGHIGITAFFLANAAAHFVQDAITSRITSRLWFFQIHEGAWRHIDVPTVRGTAMEAERLYDPFTYIDGTRHWFFVAIGADQLLHYMTLFVTAGWWLR